MSNDSEASKNEVKEERHAPVVQSPVRPKREREPEYDRSPPSMGEEVHVNVSREQLTTT